MKVECPRCHTHVEKPATGDPVCPTCGFGGPVGATAAEGSSPRAEHDAPSSAVMPPAGGDPGGWQPYANDTTQLNQTMAIVALVLGIVGCCLLGPLTGIPAAIVGGIAMKKAKDHPGEYGGYGMALAGLILGIVATVATIIWLILLAIGFSAVPDECWVDPESRECQEAQQGAEQASTSPWDSAPLYAGLAPLLAWPGPGRPTHAG